MRAKRIGEILLDLKIIDDHQLRSALGYQRQWGYRLGRCLVELRIVDEVTLTKALSMQLGIPFVRLNGARIPREVLSLVPGRIARETRAVPVAVNKSTGGKMSLMVAMADPNDLEAIDTLRFATGMDVTPVLATESDITLTIDRLYDEGWMQAAI